MFPATPVILLAAAFSVGNTMKAWTLGEVGGVDKMVMEDIEKPTPAPLEVLVEVKAIGVNPVDCGCRASAGALDMIYGKERPAVLGWDIAGIVSSTGSDVTKFKTGDRVFGMVNFVGMGKAYAEYVPAPEEHLAMIPESCSFSDAAATTLAALTALQALGPHVKKSSRVLIHAGSGGVGHYAVQLCKAWGAHVIATSSEKNKDFVMNTLGADEHIDYRSQKFEEVLSDIDVVLAVMAGDVLTNSVKVLREGGIVVSLSGPPPEEVAKLAEEKKAKTGFITVASSGSDMEKLAGYLTDGTIKPHVSKTFAFDKLPESHTAVESGRTVGKVVVSM